MTALSIPPDVPPSSGPAQRTAGGVVDFALPGHNFPVTPDGFPALRLLDAPKLTIPQAARRLGVGETKMRQLVRNGGIPVLTLGGKVMVLERDLDDFLSGQYGRLSAAPKPIVQPKVIPLPSGVRDSEMLRKGR